MLISKYEHGIGGRRRRGRSVFNPRNKAPRPTAVPQAGFGGKPKPSPRPSTTQPFFDPLADINRNYDESASSIANALFGQAQYETGRVRNRQNWQQGVLSPFADSERGVFDTQAQGVQALGNALQGAARHLGYDLQGDIGGKLSDIQAPNASQQAFAQSQGVTGEGVAGAIGGLTSAEVNALHQIGGAYGDFSAQLPRIAGLAGDAAARDIAREAALAWASKAADLQAARLGDLQQQRQWQQTFDYNTWNDAQNRRIAIIQAQAKAKAAGAKTKADRIKAYRTLAAQRTRDTGYIWKATSTGIIPVDTDPKARGIQPAYTVAGRKGLGGSQPTISATGTSYGGGPGGPDVARDKYGNPILDANGNTIPVPQDKTPAGKAAAKRTVAHNKAIKARDAAIVSATSAANSKARQLYADSRAGNKPWSWATAYYAILADMQPRLKRYGVKHDRMVEIIRYALQAAGFSTDNPAVNVPPKKAGGYVPPYLKTKQ